MATRIVTPNVEIVPDGGHFVHQEKPWIVNRLVLDLLRA